MGTRESKKATRKWVDTQSGGYSAFVHAKVATMRKGAKLTSVQKAHARARAMAGYSNTNNAKVGYDRNRAARAILEYRRIMGRKMKGETGFSPRYKEDA